MDLQEDIRQHVLANLPHNPGERLELEGYDAHQLLVIYRNWMDRLVPPQPREVHFSTALTSNPFSSDPRYKPGLDQIASFLLAGTEITPHLSRLVIREPQGLDLLLNDWGIHHLHLGTEIESDGFVKRDGPLLFAVFRPKDAYLIDIMKHGTWTDEHLIEVIVQDWPKAGIINELKGGLGRGPSITPQERKVLRRKHANAFFEFDGKVYFPVSGMMASGVTLQSVIEADRLLLIINGFEKELQKNSNFISDIFNETGITPPSEPDLHFEFFENGGYGVVERCTGLLIRLSQ